MLLERAEEALELLARGLGLLLLGLSLLDVADGLLDLLARAPDDLLGFQPGLVEDGLLLLADVLEFFLVTLRDALEGLVGMLDLLELLRP